MHTESEIQFEGMLTLLNLSEQALANQESITVEVTLMNKYDGQLHHYEVTYKRVDNAPHPTRWEYYRFERLLSF